MKEKKIYTRIYKNSYNFNHVLPHIRKIFLEEKEKNENKYITKEQKKNIKITQKILHNNSFICKYYNSG